MGGVERIFSRGITRAELKTLRVVLLVLVWGSMLALIIWGTGGVLDLLQLKREVANLQAEIDTLRRENGNLKVEIRRLQTDPAVYEGPAREMLLRKKPGEVVLYLPPAGSAPKVPRPATGAPAANSPPPAPVPTPVTPAPVQPPPAQSEAQPVPDAPVVQPPPPPDAQVPPTDAPEDRSGG